MYEMAVIAGIDVGTQSTKVVLYDEKTRDIIAQASSPHRIIAQDDGTREQKASWWTDAIRTCFDSIDERSKRRIDAIGVSGQQHGFVPLDKDGNVLYNVKLWNDTSTASECEYLTRCAGGRQKLLENEGNLILPGYTIGKILWLKNHKRELYDRLAHILLPHDYINYYLTGNITCEAGDASGTGLFNVRERTWSHRLAACIDDKRNIIECMPPLISNEKSCGTIRAEIAADLHLREDVIVSSGGGDNMMGAIGTGVVNEGTMCVSLGTSGTIFAHSSTPLIDDNGYLAAFCSSTNAYLPLLCTMNCTVATEYTRALFGKDVVSFDMEAKKAPIGCDDLVMLPYFNGERTPNYPNGKGTLIGLNQKNMTETHICRAAMESAIFSLRLGLDTFREKGYAVKEIRLIGGGAKSKVWRSMCADIFNVKIVIPEVTEGAAFGAALQALWALSTINGGGRTIQDIADEHVILDSDHIYYPDEKRVESYETAYKRYLNYMKEVEHMFK